MLTLAGVIAPREETIRLDGYTADVEWGQWGSGNVYWFISNSPKSLVEIGAHSYDGSLASISVKQIDRIYMIEQVTWDEEQGEIIVGLPCFKVEPSEKPLTYIDVNQPVCAIIDTNRIIVGIGENLKCSKRVQTEHVIFGFNDTGALVMLELYNLSEAELALVRQAIDKPAYNRKPVCLFRWLKSAVKRIRQ